MSCGFTGSTDGGSDRKDGHRSPHSSYTIVLLKSLFSLSSQQAHSHNTHINNKNENDNNNSTTTNAMTVILYLNISTILGPDEGLFRPNSPLRGIDAGLQDAHRALDAYCGHEQHAAGHVCQAQHAGHRLGMGFRVGSEGVQRAQKSNTASHIGSMRRAGLGMGYC